MKPKPDSFFRDFLSKFSEHKLAMIGSFVLALMILAVILLPIFLKLDPTTSDLTAFSAKPSSAYPLGPIRSAAICLPVSFTAGGFP